jgi:dienelactone hydrolase
MQFPEAARKTLTAAGARVKLQTYQGGHGWHGDPHKMIRTGVTWLESQSKTPATRATTVPTTTTARPRG